MKKQRGFTLIEFLIVAAIIAIVVAVTSDKFADYQARKAGVIPPTTTELVGTAQNCEIYKVQSDRHPTMYLSKCKDTTESSIKVPGTKHRSEMNSTTTTE